MLASTQNVRMTFEVHDFVGSLLGDSELAQFNLNVSLRYSDDTFSSIVHFDCSRSCVDGGFQGSIDVINERNDEVDLVIDGVMFKQDVFIIEKIALGDLILKSKIYEESRGVVENSCSGVVTGNVLFGKAGVGKSTIGSLISSKPGLFEVGTSGQGTTTLGTWLSSSLVDGQYCKFADNQFQPEDLLPENIPVLETLDAYYTNKTNLVFMDTEGLDYQTEFGDNYDVVTILPHTLIAENVFLVVRDRVNPAEVIELIDKLATAAEKTKGTLSHRHGKLFGRFFIVVNKAQDISLSDEQELALLKHNNPSLFTKVLTYFTFGPEIVMLPLLEWDYAVKPDFNQDGFYLDYDHIRLAHPPLRDRMFYGLHKIAAHIADGVPTDQLYSIRCETFEQMLEQIYDATSEDVIDINQLDYEWQLKEAMHELENFVRKFNMTETGLNNEILSGVCPEADVDLMDCISREVNNYNEEFYLLCQNQILLIFPKGKEDLQSYLDNELFPYYVDQPVQNWFETCALMFDQKDIYSQSFLTTFEESKFYEKCKLSVNGKLSWMDWETCSKTCKSNDTCGVRIRIAESCLPIYSTCKNIQVEREDCNCIECQPETEKDPGHFEWFDWEKCSQTCSSDGNCGVQVRYAKECQPVGSVCDGVPVERRDCGCQSCPPDNSRLELPIGTIIPWVPKPNRFVSNTESFHSYHGWIKCDGLETCSDGPFKGKFCTDLSDMALIGSYADFKVVHTYGASFPDHAHPHTHSTKVRYKKK